MQYDRRGFLRARATAATQKSTTASIAGRVVHGSKSDREISMSCRSVSLEGMG